MKERERQQLRNRVNIGLHVRHEDGWQEERADAKREIEKIKKEREKKNEKLDRLGRNIEIQKSWNDSEVKETIQ